MGGENGFALWFGFSVGLIVVGFGSLCGLGGWWLCGFVGGDWFLVLGLAGIVRPGFWVFSGFGLFGLVLVVLGVAM